MLSYDELQELVDRLDSNERRAVTMVMQRSKGNVTQQQLLFSELCNNKPVGELSQKLKLSPAAFANLRQSLFRTILKTLRNLQGTDNIDNELKEMQVNAQLLFSRRCYVQSMEELEKAAELAREFERRCILLEILFFQCSITLERNADRMNEKLAMLHQEIHSVLAELELEAQLKQLREESFLLLRTRFAVRSQELHKKLDVLFTQSLPHDQELTLIQAHHAAYARANRHLCLNEYDKAVPIYEELILLWEKEQNRTRRESNLVLILLSNYANAVFSAGLLKAFQEALRKLKSHKTYSLEEEAEKFQNTYYLELLHLLNHDGFDRLDTLVDEIEKGLVKYKTKINKGRELAFYHNIAMGYFLSHEWKKSLTWIERIIAQEKSEHRQDLKYTARMLRLVLWYELGKHDLLEYELINVERFLKTRHAWHAYESTVVKFFDKLPHSKGREQKEFIEKFNVNLKTALDGKTSAALPGSSELSYWTKSKLSGKTMRELLEEDKKMSR